MHRRSPTMNSVCVSTAASLPDDHHRNDHHRDRELVGETTPTDPRARRNRASGRGGHLLARADSSPNNTGPSSPARRPIGQATPWVIHTNLFNARQEIRSAAMISQAPDGFARFIPVARGLTPRRPASGSVPPAGVAQERVCIARSWSPPAEQPRVFGLIEEVCIVGQCVRSGGDRGRSA